MMFARPCPGCGDHRFYPCARCIADLLPAGPIDIDGAASAMGVMAYAGASKGFIAELKQPGGTAFGRWIADGLAAISPDDVDLVSWVPASLGGRRLRGHDQGRVLARAVGRRLGRRCVQTLRRLDDDRQTGRSREERSRMAMHCSSKLGGAAVLLVDDVHTTGASARAAVDALMVAGASHVHVRVIAVVGHPSTYSAASRLQ
jgi:predicted amidophosphoribosyltransferase